LSRGRAYSVAGGGESLDVLESAKVATEIDWVSTGGGAMLTLLAKRKLPGLEALRKS
jgi:phosphoglycerate kinase